MFFTALFYIANKNVVSLDNDVFRSFFNIFKTENDFSPLTLERGMKTKTFNAISTFGKEQFDFDFISVSSSDRAKIIFFFIRKMTYY